LPIQIIDSRRLTTEDNLWLRTLSNKLEYQAVIEISKEISRQRKNARLGAFLDVITRANPKAVKEAIKMGNKLTLNEVLLETGLATEWEARGIEKKAVEIAGNMLKNGFSVEQTAALSGLDVARVRELETGEI
jgi:predicted transposase YdaD